ncbi:MAG TPA: FtsX-like permease family protein [Pseudomonadales bacterium]|nr:FtsX-like permease family protein [Pseudomonadales bacterium]
MPVKLLVALSWRNLLRNARRTVMLVLAVVIGVAALVMIAALLRGWLASTVDDALAGLTGHVRIHAPGWIDDPGVAHAFHLDAAVQAELAGDGDVIAWGTRIRLPAVIMSERETRGVMLVGIDPAAERNLSFVGDVPLSGTALTGPADSGLLLGAALLEELETDVGKRVVLMLQGRDGGTVERGYRIVGAFDAQSEAREQGFAFTGRDALGETLGMRAGDGAVTELSMRLSDRAAEALDGEAAAWATRLPGLEVHTWRDLMPQAVAMVEVSEGTIWIWYLIMMAALGFGLVNTLLASVLERVRELGLLQAIGMRPSGILWQVILESWLILGVGLVLGLLLGYGIVRSLADGIDLGRWAEGMEMMGVSRVLIPRMEVTDLLQIGGVVVLLGLFGSLYPARKAVAIDPLAALSRRQE